MLHNPFVKKSTQSPEQRQSNRPAIKSLVSEYNLSRLEGFGVVTETIFPGAIGRIQHCGSWWFAQCDQDVTLVPGDEVYVFGIHDLTLWVVPAIDARNALILR